MPSEVSLSQYQVDAPQQASNSQRLLIGVPLMVTLVFSFCFVALNPSRDKTAAVNASAKGEKTRNTKPTPLPPLPTSVAPEQTLNTEPTNSAPAASSSSYAASSSSPAANRAANAATPGAAPQAKPSTTTGSVSPQATSARQTTIDARYKINVNLSNTTKKLLGW